MICLVHGRAAHAPFRDAQHLSVSFGFTFSYQRKGKGG
jgi:hypothetical protein